MATYQTMPAKRKLQTDMLSLAMGKLVKKKNLRILCLPGKDAWDLGFFAPYSNVKEIVGVENNKVIAKRLEGENHKKARIHYGLTSEYLAEEEKPFDLVYLDYMVGFGFVVALDFELMV